MYLFPTSFLPSRISPPQSKWLQTAKKISIKYGKIAQFVELIFQNLSCMINSQIRILLEWENTLILPEFSNYFSMKEEYNYGKA